MSLPVTPTGARSRPATPPPQWAEADSLLPDTPVHALDVVSTVAGDARRARLALYASHFLSTWAQRAWEFCVGLLMLRIYPSSFFLVATFGLLDAGVQVAAGPQVGAFIDRTPRLRAATAAYLVQNLSVAGSAGACLALLWMQLQPEGRLYWCLVTAAIAAGCLSSVGAMAATLSVEKEWTKALSCGDSAGVLADMNAVMKRLDLTCLILSPVLVGVVMAWRPDAAVIAIVLWNLASWAPECLLLRRAHAASPALQALPDKLARMSGSKAFSDGSSAASPDFSSGGGGGSHGGAWQRQLEAWLLYVRQPAAPAALALAVLYLTVMSFGSLMTVYLFWRGMEEGELALYRSLGALSGIAATVAFPPLQRSAGLVPTAVAAIWTQLLCLVLALLPALLGPAARAGDGSPWTRVLVAGLVLSRFGLWLFDLCVSQLIQQTAAPGTLGAVCGVQSSLQSFCQMAAYAAGVAGASPDKFVYLMAGSVGAVGVAAALVTVFASRSGCGATLDSHHLPMPLTP